MNIFVLSEDPVEAAQYQCDRHAVKMVLESGQMLATVCHQHGIAAPIKMTHPKHPCTLWAGEAAENYAWLWRHMGALLHEYHLRYGKVHAFTALHGWLWANKPALPPRGAPTPFAQAMPEQYRVPGDAVAAYRAYYNAEKAHFCKWKLGNIPPWFVPRP